METSGVLADTVSPSVTNFSAMNRVSLPPVQSANTVVYPSRIRAVSNWARAFNTRAWAVSTRALAASHDALAASTWEAEDTPLFFRVSMRSSSRFAMSRAFSAPVRSASATARSASAWAKAWIYSSLSRRATSCFRRTGSPMSTARYSTRPLTLGATRNSALEARDPLKVRRSSMGPRSMGAVSTGAAQVSSPGRPGFSGLNHGPVKKKYTPRTVTGMTSHLSVRIIMASSR